MVMIMANRDWTCLHQALGEVLHKWDLTESLRVMDYDYLLFTDGEIEASRS